MRKGWLALAVLAFSSAVCAQNQTTLGKEDLLTAFEQYNPVALEKAAQDEQYAAILEELISAYEEPRTETSQYEMIALAKNFEQSIALHLIGQNYLQQFTLQQMSGQVLPAWRENMFADLTPVMQQVLDNTLFVRNLQIKEYKEQIKQLSRDKSLFAVQKKQQQDQLKEQIRQVKQEIKGLKANRNKTIRAALEDYTDQILSDYEAAQFLQARAEESNAYDVKANHKKPVAK